MKENLKRVPLAIKTGTDFNRGGFYDVFIFVLTNDLTASINLDVGHKGAICGNQCCRIIRSFQLNKLKSTS